MDVTIIPPEGVLQEERAFSLSMTVRTFKGRRDVDIHLFRHSWDQAEEQAYDWDTLIGPPLDVDTPVSPVETAGSRLVLLESFTRKERDMIVDFLTQQYQDRLTAIRSRPLTFPIPSGLTGLSQVRAGENIGLVDFSRIHSYTLPIPLRGLYDLNQHKPIIATTETNP